MELPYWTRPLAQFLIRQGVKIMINGFLHRTDIIHNEGETLLFSPDVGKVNTITLSLLIIQKGDSYFIPGDNNERVLILLSGNINGSCGNMKFKELGVRKSVFDGKASAIYLSSFTDLTLSANTDTEIIIASAPCEKNGFESKIIRPGDVSAKTVGKNNWVRNVHDILPGEFNANKLIVGETFNYPGMWSSFPPHKHDKNNPPVETCFEELYYYRINPNQGFGYQRIYSPEHDFDDCYVVKNNDVVEIPFGYHPVTAGPGYDLYYLWVLSGESRNPIWNEDPDHNWVNV